MNDLDLELNPYNVPRSNLNMPIESHNVISYLMPIVMFALSVISITHKVLIKSEPTYLHNLINIKPTCSSDHFRLSLSSLHPSHPSLNSMIVPSIIPPLISGTLCLLIYLSQNSTFTYHHPSLTFHSLHSLYFAINFSRALKYISSSFLTPPP